MTQQTEALTLALEYLKANKPKISEGSLPVLIHAQVCAAIKEALARPAPLTNEVIWLEYQRFWPFHPAEEPTLAKDIVKFAQAIEAAHGIK